MTCHARVLLVEDDRDIREILAEVLEEEGYEVATAANGKEALDVLRDQPLPAVLLLDMMMPVMDGWQLHAEMAKVDELASIPVIVLSADGEQTGVRAAGRLRKPLDVLELLAMVERVTAAND